jgi:hypothetical protein
MTDIYELWVHYSEDHGIRTRTHHSTNTSQYMYETLVFQSREDAEAHLVGVVLANPWMADYKFAPAKIKDLPDTMRRLAVNHAVQRRWVIA